jgi:hypothetical protein
MPLPRKSDARFMVVAAADHLSSLESLALSPVFSRGPTPRDAEGETDAGAFTFAEAFDFSSLHIQQSNAAEQQDADHVYSWSSSGDASPSVRRLLVSMEGAGAVVLGRRSPSPALPSSSPCEAETTESLMEREAAAVAAWMSPARRLRARLRQLPSSNPHLTRPGEFSAANEELQRDEICALRSILGGDVVDSGANHVSWCLRVPLAEGGCSIVLMPWHTSLTLEYLPDIIVTAFLPPAYPSSAPPHFFLDSPWLTPEAAAQFALEMAALWTPAAECLYSVYQATADKAAQLCAHMVALDFSFLASAPNIRARECAAQALSEHSRDRQAAVFRDTYFKCSLCFDSKSGSVCHRIIICKHVFCQKCIGGFFSSVIREGELRQLKCPCPGCDVQPLDVELRSLVDEQDYIRYSAALCVAPICAHLMPLLLLLTSACEMQVRAADATALAGASWCCRVPLLYAHRVSRAT